MERIHDALYVECREQAEREATPSFLLSRSFFVEGLLALIMYRSLRIMHDQALGGAVRAALGVVVRIFSRRTGPETE